MDDQDERSFGSRKSTEQACTPLREWQDILNDVGDKIGEPVSGADAAPFPQTAIPSGSGALDSTRDLMTSDHLPPGVAQGSSRTGAAVKGTGAAVRSREQDNAEPILLRKAAWELRRASLFDRSNSSAMFLTTQTKHPPSGMEDIPPPLAIGLKPITLGFEGNIGPDLIQTAPLEADIFSTRNPSRLVCQSSEVEKADRKVIVTKQSSDELSVGTPTPLGNNRRPSLFERVNSARDGGQQSAAGSVDGMMLDSGIAGSLEIEKGLEEGPRQNSLSPGQGTQNTVSRDWLMHVLEKDYHYNTKEVQDIWAAGRRRRRLAHRTFEAADYELYDSKVWHMHKREVVRKTRGGTMDLKRHRKHFARLLTVALGIVVGLSGCFVTYFTETIIESKLHFVAHVIEHHDDKSAFRRYGSAFGWLWFFNIILAAGAFGLVVYNPWSSGSGIPETKCVLNGVSIPQVLSPSTLVCKLLGVVLGVASGLPIGKEGPMIHAGAAIGGGIASVPRIEGLSHFRNDRDRRDLAAIGTAAGVAAAFRTPIGGVLFAIEEGASFWSTLLTWRSFAAAVVTVVMYYLVFRGQDMFKRPLVPEDLFLFGEFRDADSQFYMWELSVFALIATLGGLIGAIFVACNKRFDLFRARHVKGPRRRFLEMACISTLTSAVSFFLPLAMGECREVPTDIQDWSPAGIESLHHLVTLNCHEGYYNELGSLFLNEQDRVIKLLFHFASPGLRPATVLLFAVVFISLECMTIGMWVCSGLFIPSLLVGAAMGRGLGALLGRNSRTYALIGAAGILGGIARSTLSLTVMMVEASGWVLFVIPLMLVFIVARSVGNRFNEGIYDTQIGVKKMPFLEQEPPEETRAQNLRANQLMSKEVVCLRPIETVAAVVSALRGYDHNCFPVVEDRDQRVLLGTVHRKNLSVLLKHRHFTAPSAHDPARPDDSLPPLSWEVLEDSYPNYPKFHELEIRVDDMDGLVDIAAYVQIGPHVINEHASAHRAYIMFRTLGLRHLVVVNHYNEVMGMITRENLLPEHFERGGAYHSADGAGCSAGKENKQKSDA